MFITTLISPSASIPYARVQLGHYAEQHGEHYICVEGGTLVSEEEPHLAESYECNQEKGGIVSLYCNNICFSCSHFL